MADQAFEKLIFALDGDLSALKGKYAQAEADAATTGKKISENLSLKGAASQAASDAGALTRQLGAVGNAGREAGRGIEVSRRELIYFGREIATGDFQRLPSTLALIASHMVGLSGATILWGIGIAAIPAGFALATIQVENSLARIRSAMQLTANYSGVTMGNAAAALDQMVASGRYSPIGANNELAGLIRGGVPAQYGGQAGVAASNYALGADVKSEEANKLIEQMFADPTKSIQALNEQIHLLNTAQTEEVDRLQRQGDAQDAGKIILDAFSERAKNAADSASAFSKMLDSASTGLGKFWAFLGGNDASDKVMLAQYKGQLSAAQADNPKGFRDAQIAALKALIAPLEAKYAPPAAGAAGSPEDRSISQALKLANTDSGKFSDHIKELNDEFIKASKGLDDAKKTHSEYTGTIQKEVDALKIARANQRTPEQIAAQAADDQRKIAATPLLKRPQVEAQIAAQREYERNLSNPATALQAKSIYDSQMSVAGIAKMSAAEDSLSARQAKTLAGMEAESAAEIALAKSYELGSAAVAKQKAAGEAHTALVKKEIADEVSYARALQERAFATEAVAVAQKISNDNENLTGLRRIGAANGDPAAIARAEVINAALLVTQKERDNAVTAEQIALADKHLKQLEQELSLTKEQTATNSALSDISKAQRGYGYAQNTAAAMFSGASSDDLRHLQIAQSTFETLITTGLDPSTEKFQGLYRTLLTVNSATSDLAEHMQQLEQEATDFASAITGPLQQFVTTGGSLKSLGSNILKQEGLATIKDGLIDPLQKELKSVFSGFLGIGGKPDGSVTNPFNVIVSPLSAGLGGLGSGGGLGGLIGNLFGGSSFFDPLQGPFGGGKADGGNIDPGKFYVVGEKGPEILGPGHTGSITPMNRANFSAPANNNMVIHSTHVFSISVSGVGDNDLLTKVHTAVNQGVKAGIETNNKMLNKTQRSNFIKSNRRALP